MKLLIATHNRGKLSEYAEILEGLPFELVTLDDVGIADDVEETGATLLENARLKALTYARQSGLRALADDSGLEVDALGGEPGVYSKRYAGESKSDAERNAYVLEKMRGVPQAKRTARFRCAIVIADAQGQTWTSEGTCDGEIAFEARGTNGFGYDPIFIVNEVGKHMAELPNEVKNRVSHRGRAAIGARENLERLAKIM
ncbi:MAG: XTP/dITP diphosphatase [Chloroflexi bacterium]|nr:XTP/dITP diphosphatase [Chloroflexota bacterium]